MTTKHIVVIFALIVLAIFIVGIARESNPKVTIPTLPDTQTVVPSDTSSKLCYYRSDKTSSGFYDRAWIRLTVSGTTATGEFQNLPAEKDRKIGTFSGTVSAPDAQGKQIATLIWDSQAEGMSNKEELLVKYGSGSAQAAFGEMVLGANGVYVYKDKTKAVYQTAIPQVDCAVLDEAVTVETYVRNTDLAKITKDQPVLGGKLFVSSIVVDPKTHTALISYEDGHVSGKGTLTYTYTSGKVTVVSFAKAK